MDEDQSQQQQQQPDVRELLAKHTKQRQSKKKQEESRQQQQEQQLTAGSGSQLPLRHWPDDTSSITHSMYSCTLRVVVFVIVLCSSVCSGYRHFIFIISHITIIQWSISGYWNSFVAYLSVGVSVCLCVCLSVR